MAPSLPNIVFITADGLRADALGCAGNPDVQTPNIDALAAHGIRFTNAISPIPGYPSGGHTCLTGDVPPCTLPGERPQRPLSGALRLVRALAEAGYTTAVIGGPNLHSDAFRPLFREAVVTGCDEGPDDYIAWLAEAGKECVNAPRNDRLPSPAPFPLPEQFHPTTWTGSQAVRFCQRGVEPFFLWVAFPRPWPPLDPPMPWREMYRPARLELPRDVAAGHAEAPSHGARLQRARRQLPMRRTLAAYYATASHVDHQIGRILATLTARGRTNNMFVLTAGAGLALAPDAERPQAFTSLGEPRIRVPLIVSGHVGQRRGAVEPSLVALGDLPPTLLDTLSLSPRYALEGRSFSRLLTQSGLPHREMVPLQDPSGTAGLRTTRYKWLLLPEGAGEALFDLQADPLELHNLAEDRRARAIRKVLWGVARR